MAETNGPQSQLCFSSWTHSWADFTASLAVWHVTEFELTECESKWQVWKWHIFLVLKCPPHAIFRPILPFWQTNGEVGVMALEAMYWRGHASGIWAPTWLWGPPQWSAPCPTGNTVLMSLKQHAFWQLVLLSSIWPVTKLGPYIFSLKIFKKAINMHLCNRLILYTQDIYTHLTHKYMHTHIHVKGNNW